MGKHVNHYKVGDSLLMNCGVIATIISKRCYKDIDVLFESGEIITNRSINEFTKGTIHCPSLKRNTSIKTNRLGEIKRMNCGMNAKIIKYNKYEDIDVEFDDGYVSKNKTYESFKRGSIVNEKVKHKYHHSKRDERIGEVIKNKQGCFMKIIDYDNYNKIVVEFQDEYKFILNSNYGNFKNGTIMNPYHKTYKDVACIGNTIAFENYKPKKAYGHWAGMIERCYGKSKRNMCYKNVVVCEEWLCFENFEKWFNVNYYEIDGEVMVLDKDIISYYKNIDKQYSPRNCCFVPNEINIKFKTEDRVAFSDERNKDKKYSASYSNTYLGSFDNLEDAKKTYCEEKTNVYLQLANKYKNKVPTEIYEVLINCKGE